MKPTPFTSDRSQLVLLLGTMPTGGEQTTPKSKAIRSEWVHFDYALELRNALARAFDDLKLWAPEPLHNLWRHLVALLADASTYLKQHPADTAAAALAEDLQQYEATLDVLSDPELRLALHTR